MPLRGASELRARVRGVVAASGLARPGRAHAGARSAFLYSKDFKWLCVPAAAAKKGGRGLAPKVLTQIVAWW